MNDNNNQPEVENVRVMVRRKAQSFEEKCEGQKIVHVMDNTIELTPPTSEGYESLIPQGLKTPKSHKAGPPKTPKRLTAANQMLNLPEPKIPVLPTTPNRNSIATPKKPASQNKTIQNSKVFAFDKVWAEDVAQKEIFSDVEHYIDSVTQGYNSTIFAYGQTGAGKTYTMVGPSHDPGIIPRAIHRLFHMIEQSQDMYSVKMTYVELHIDQFFDLLDPTNQDSKLRKNSLRGQTGGWGSLSKKKKITVHEDNKSNTFITGSETLQMVVTSADEALQLFHDGNLARSIAPTQMNQQSSRSHSILTFDVECKSRLSSSVRAGKLHLVDLAGSERLNRSGVVGLALQETQAINSSLSALGDVLSALSSKSFNGLIPYRNSKLTHLLKDSLGGNAKTLFIINIDCHERNYSETSLSLSYGQRAKQVKNITSVNKDQNTESEISVMRSELETLRSKFIEKSKEYESLKKDHVQSVSDNRRLQNKVQMMGKITQEEIENLETEMQNIMNTHGGEVTELRITLVNLQNELNEKTEEIEKLKIDLNKAHQKLEKAVKKNKSHEEEIQQLKVQKRNAEFQQQEYLCELTELKKQPKQNSLEEQLKKMETEKEMLSIEHVRDSTKYEQKIKELKKANERLTRENQKLQQKTETLSESKMEIHQLKQDLQLQNKKIEELSSSQKESPIKHADEPLPVRTKKMKAEAPAVDEDKDQEDSLELVPEPLKTSETHESVVSQNEEPEVPNEEVEIPKKSKSSKSTKQRKLKEEAQPEETENDTNQKEKKRRSSREKKSSKKTEKTSSRKSENTEQTPSLDSENIENTPSFESEKIEKPQKSSTREKKSKENKAPEEAAKSPVKASMSKRKVEDNIFSEKKVKVDSPLKQIKQKLSPKTVREIKPKIQPKKNVLSGLFNQGFSISSMSKLANKPPKVINKENLSTLE